MLPVEDIESAEDACGRIDVAPDTRGERHDPVIKYRKRRGSVSGSVADLFTGCHYVGATGTRIGADFTCESSSELSSHAFGELVGALDVSYQYSAAVPVELPGVATMKPLIIDASMANATTVKPLMLTRRV